MSEASPAAECSIVTRSRLRKSFMARLAANYSDLPLKSRNSESTDVPHLIRCMLTTRNPDSSCAQTVKTSARSASISPVKERIILPPALPVPTLASKRSDSVPCKKKCLCAPTTHAGSFRCRLHRLPPSQTVSAAARKGISQLSSSKARLAINQRSMSTSNARLHEAKASRLSRVTMAEEQNQATMTDGVPSAMEEVPTTANSAVGVSVSVKNGVAHETEECL